MSWSRTFIYLLRGPILGMMGAAIYAAILFLLIVDPELIEGEFFDTMGTLLIVWIGIILYAGFYGFVIGTFAAGTAGVILGYIQYKHESLSYLTAKTTKRIIQLFTVWMGLATAMYLSGEMVIRWYDVTVYGTFRETLCCHMTFFFSLAVLLPPLICMGAVYLTAQRYVEKYLDIHK